LTDEERWRAIEPPLRGPSAQPDLRFNPLATGIGVFAGIAIPIVVFGYTRPAGVDTAIIVIGVIVGLLAGFLVGLWVARRGGAVWRGPRL
jgi:hypothetical protein